VLIGDNMNKLLMIFLMVATGSLNTISTGLQLARQANDKNGEPSYFDHYFVQTLFMFFGECLCGIVYIILKYVVYKKTPEKVDGEDPKPMNPLLLWPAAFLDIIGTTCDGMGMGFMRNPGFNQMLRATPIVFCGLLSRIFLGRKLLFHHWLGIIVIWLGLIIKAIPDVAAGFATHDDFPILLPPDLNDWNACNVHLGPYMNLTDGTTPSPEIAGSSTANDVLIGILITLVGEFFHGCQFFYEELVIGKYNLPVLKCVAYEGLNGAVTLLILLWPMYYIKMPEAFGLGPDHRMEDIFNAFKMTFNGGPENGGWLLAWTIGCMFSIAVFNFSGMSVTKELSATTRAVIDQIRIVIIWLCFLIPFGPFLCRLQDHFIFTAPIGLIILISGVFIYNDVIILPLIRKFILKKDPHPTQEIQRKEVES